MSVAPKMIIPCGLLAWCLSTVVVAAPPIEEDGVLVLDDSNFLETVKTHPFILVEFYAPWCGHCKQFAPEYAAAAKQLQQANPPVPLAKIDATVEVKSAEEYNVRGYPTVRFFVDGKDQEYTGGRTSQSVVTWVTKKTGPPAVLLEDVAAADAYQAQHQLLVLAVFPEGAPRTAFESVARGIEDVYFAYSTNAAVAAKYGMTAPGVRMFFPHDETVADYTGDVNDVAGLENFVKLRRQPIITPFTAETASDLMNDGRPILFLFKASADDVASKKAEEAVREAAPKFGRRILVSICGQTEPMEQRLLDYISVEEKELPTFRLVTEAAGSMSKYKMEGEHTAAALLQFLDEFEAGRGKKHLKSEEPPAAQSGPVVTLVGKTFESVVMDSTKDVFVEFYAPWCGHCKKLEPVYRDVARKLEGVNTLVIAKIDATANDVEGVEVEGFPTLKLFRADKKDDPLDYDGDRDVDSFVTWLEDKVSLAFNHNEVKTEL
eukprot:TRINITY_DN40773_c0_g1_i1.p1 TRINITY_DN40773_c0_g1~~TRINITY_DN40773_c0_g1_i1.p1  ORF type:complete len:510 (+),score=101.76 TRINITY_DN40773_c0_g1_i1:62-1531(+)